MRVTTEEVEAGRKESRNFVEICSICRSRRIAEGCVVSGGLEV